MEYVLYNLSGKSAALDPEMEAKDLKKVNNIEPLSEIYFSSHPRKKKVQCCSSSSCGTLSQLSYKPSLNSQFLKSHLFRLALYALPLTGLLV